MIFHDAFNSLIVFKIEWQVINKILIIRWRNFEGKALTCCSPAALANMKAVCWFPAVFTDKLTGSCPKGQGFKNKCHSAGALPPSCWDERKHSFRDARLSHRGNWSSRIVKWFNAVCRCFPVLVVISEMRSQTTFLCSSSALKTDCCRVCCTHRWCLNQEYLQHPLKKQ